MPVLPVGAGITRSKNLDMDFICVPWQGVTYSNSTATFVEIPEATRTITLETKRAIEAQWRVIVKPSVADTITEVQLRFIEITTGGTFIFPYKFSMAAAKEHSLFLHEFLPYALGPGDIQIKLGTIAWDLQTVTVSMFSWGLVMYKTLRIQEL